jgi:hypothetical protein
MVPNTLGVIFFISGQMYYQFSMEALFAAAENVNAMDGSLATNGDLLEIPAGSTVLYQCTYVDDIGKGFANEHRFAILHRIAQDCVFADITIPMPHPIP